MMKNPFKALRSEQALFLWTGTAMGSRYHRAVRVLLRRRGEAENKAVPVWHGLCGVGLQSTQVGTKPPPGRSVCPRCAANPAFNRRELIVKTYWLLGPRFHIVWDEPEAV